MLRRFATLCLLALPAAAWAQQAPAAKPLVIIDLRPDEEKSGHALTPLEGKCNKDVYRIADVASDPSKLDVLTEYLRNQLGDAGNGKTLTVLNWSIYYNKQVRVSGGGLGNIGVQGYSLPGKKKERKAGSVCARDQSAGGWYEAGELTSSYFPLVSEFQGTLGGKLLKARVVHSPPGKLAGEFAGDAQDTEQLLEVVNQTADAVAMAIVQ
jgi:hypothetical protein